MIVLAGLTHGRCCCCCGDSRARLLTARLSGASGRLAAGAEGGAAAQRGGEFLAGAAAADSPLSWQRSPRAGVVYTVPPLLYRALTRAAVDPVIVLSRCGQDRDCVPDERVVDSYLTAERNAYPWIAKGNNRTVDIFTHPDRVLLRHFVGAATDYVEFKATTRDESEMRLIQKSPNSGRFGFYAP